MRSAAAEQERRSVAGETVVGSELCVMGYALGPEIHLAKSARGFQKQLDDTIQNYGPSY